MSPPESSPPQPDRRGLFKVLAAVVIVCGAIIGYLYLDEHWPYRHFRTVDEGVFYRSAQLSPDDLSEAIQDYGIKTVINLREGSARAVGTWWDDERQASTRGGATHVDVPLQAGTPPSPEQIELLLSILDDPERVPVLVHCYHGTVRAAAAEGLYRREYMGESGDVALDRVSTWGKSLPKKYPEIAEFIRTYEPRSRKPPSGKSGEGTPERAPRSR